ncbi:hypothetical protein DICPUDRAFT_83562 [Dictyostelium purpureum]|uniref:Uncharacterized protein n=1 Tax=Dictyostelium purpureum TaxID=5786 RepID=F0ZZW4_DICPU|nr:uncharacterized protein DICPUDRAFT_83562 [Dictyostelium purpureum]EGC30510.1 hypothetical protein DICPUDRAFT_83562 [Dictyostelium purpureum]|eukprot:XP_003292958.1 hypothetical protein DICPUDRAFT_83562 [Dictyostelium purpureum]
MIQIIILFLITLLLVVYLKCFSPLKLYCKKNKKNTKNNNNKGTYSHNTPSTQYSVSLTSYLEQRLHTPSTYPNVAQNSPSVQHSQYYKNQPQQNIMYSPAPKSFNSSPVQQSQYYYNQPQKNYMNHLPLNHLITHQFNKHNIIITNHNKALCIHMYHNHLIPNQFNNQDIIIANLNKCIIDSNSLYDPLDSPFYVEKHQQQGSGYSTTGAPS